jgi:CBS domain-containing protein
MKTDAPFIVTRYRRSKYELILEAIRNSVNQSKDIMIADVVCCTPEHTVQEAAEMMARHNCGEIAIVESEENLKPVGVITDRDITWRVVASGKRPEQTSVGDAMSSF